MKRILSTILLFLILSTTTIGQEILWEPFPSFYDLPNGEKALSIIHGDNLQFPVGSAPLNPGVNYENLNLNQATFGIWIESLYFEPGDGVLHYFMDNVGTSVAENRSTFLFTITGLLRFFVYDDDSTSHYVQFDATGWTIGERHQIVGIIDFKNDYIALFVDGSLEDDVPTGALASDSIDVIESVIHFGSDSIAANQLNGSSAIQIWDVVKDSTWVTAQWNSGDGLPFVVDADTILLARFSEENTGIVYHHSGKLVSSITAGGTEATFVSAAGSDIIKDNDALIVQDGTGHSVPFFADGDWGDTGGDGNDGAGGAVADIEKVGVHANLSGESFSRSDADFPESGILGNLTIQAWVRFVNTTTSGDDIVTKWGTPNRMYALSRKGNHVEFYISSDGANVSLAKFTSPILRKNIFMHLACVYDAGAGTADLYYNGVFIQQKGVFNSIADKVPSFRIGHITQAGQFYGSIFNVALFDDKRSPSEILASATDPMEDLGGAGNIIGQWMFNDDAAVTRIDNLQGDADRDLFLFDGDTTNYGTHSREQQAYIGKNLLITDENGGIGGHTPGDTASVISKSTTEIFKDSLSLKVLNGDGTQAYDRFTVTTVTGRDYWFHGRFFAPDTPNGASRLVDVDGVAALGVTVTQAGLGAGWNLIEFCFEAQDTSTTIDLGSGSVTNTEFGYWDDAQLRGNRITNGGMESFIGGDPNLPTGWSGHNLDPGDSVEENVEQHSGSACIKLTVTAYEGIKATFSLAVDQYYTYSVYIKTNVGSRAVEISSGNFGSNFSQIFTPTTDWKRYSVTFNPGSDGVGTIIIKALASGTFYIDDASLIPNDTAPATVATKGTGFWPLTNPMWIPR